MWHTSFAKLYQFTHVECTVIMICTMRKIVPQKKIFIVLLWHFYYASGFYRVYYHAPCRGKLSSAINFSNKSFRKAIPKSVQNTMSETSNRTHVGKLAQRHTRAGRVVQVVAPHWVVVDAAPRRYAIGVRDRLASHVTVEIDTSNNHFETC